MEQIKVMQPVGPILEQTKRFVEKQQAAPESSRPECGLCKRTDWTAAQSGMGWCHSCEQAAGSARSFREAHFVIPPRYRTKLGEVALKQWPVGDKGLLLVGEQGVGKTHMGYALIAMSVKGDARLSAASYSWPYVLSRLRAGYSNQEAAKEAEGITAGLRDADLSMLDDLGAEKITDGNSGWIQETLFVILDHRWNWCKRTILTSNLEAAQLEQYLGARISSRIAGMCEAVKLTGQDRRLG